MDTSTPPAPLKSPENPFRFINLLDPTFCRLLEESADAVRFYLHPDLTKYEIAIMCRLAHCADYLVPLVNRITETPLQGVFRVTFKGRVSQTAMRAIDTSGLLKTVGCYSVGQGSWAISVRLVR